MISKLTEEDVDRLRLLSKKGHTNRFLMQEFGVSRSTVERYKFDNLRELSRIIQRKRNKIEKVCYQCGLFKNFPPKCARCEIFVHNGKDYCSSHLPQ